MDPILFYGVPEGCSFGSIVALEWLGEPYRLCRIAMPDVVAGPRFAGINPIGETPALMVEDGATLSQSMAILGHVARRARARSLAIAPDDERLTEMLAFLNTSFFEAFTPLWHVMEHDSPGAQRAVLTAYGRAAVIRAHGQLEAWLGDRDWLVGQGPTLADAYFAGIARWADVHRTFPPGSFPALERLRARLETDPAVRFAHAVERSEAATSAGGFLGHVELDAVERPQLP
jgi:glutathione S-transferase